MMDAERKTYRIGPRAGIGVAGLVYLVAGGLFVLLPVAWTLGLVEVNDEARATSAEDFAVVICSVGLGAAAANAVQALVQLAATFHTPDGRVAVEGFYEQVRALMPAEREEIASVPFDPAQVQEELGAPALWGEPSYSQLERRWTRPTLDLNGFWGGFEGEGTKTVTPCEAHVKITCRLVPAEEPEEILDLIERHGARHCPASARATVRRFPGSARPFAIRRDHPALEPARRVLRELYGKEPVVVCSGGTLPVSGIFRNELGIDSVSFSWGMSGNQIHAPNEWMRLDLRRAMRAYCAYLTALAR